MRRITRQAQKIYEKNLAKEVVKNPKKFWSYASSKSKIRVGVPNLSKSGNDKGDNLTNNDKEKAEVLSQFFSSVFTREPEGNWNLPESKQFEHELQINLSEAAVHKLLSKIKISKSPGPDQVHPRVLSELKNTLAKPLSIIFNTSMRTGTLPQEWKSANITAIFKKGSKRVAGNYRPVSLTSILCKLMETLVRNALVDYMQKNDLFTDKQFGFISGRSTVLQLIKVLDRWTEILDSGGSIDIIYCDFMKAFDKVPHRRLIQKLEFYGIKTPILGWIQAFLSDRKQRVIVNGEASEWQGVLSGIPQGSVLGPILFVIYINTLPLVAKKCEIFLFADDTKIFKDITTVEDCQKLQNDFDNMYNWTSNSLLMFHPDKCK